MAAARPKRAERPVAALTRPLASLGDDYDTVEYGSGTVQEIDAHVAAEARRIVSPRVVRPPSAGR